MNSEHAPTIPLTIKRYWPGAVDDMNGLRAVMDEHPDGDWVLYSDAERQLLAALRENREKDAQLAECYRLSGADPDGNEDWRLAPHAVAEVKRLREESDESDRLLIEKDARIAELTRLLGDEHRADVIINEIVKKYMADAEAAEAKLRAILEAK